jgi:glutaredoxin 3
VLSALGIFLSKFQLESNLAPYGARRSGMGGAPGGHRSLLRRETDYLKEQRSVGNNGKEIEVFSAGCTACNETIDMVKRLAGSHEVVLHDMNKAEVAAKAKSHGVRSVPAVVIDGKLGAAPAVVLKRRS